MITLDKKYTWDFEGVSKEDTKKIVEYNEPKWNKDGSYPCLYIPYFHFNTEEMRWYLIEEIAKEIRYVKDLLENPVVEYSTPKYYDNSEERGGSLYKVATKRDWNPYLFDVVKRLERGGKKDDLIQEINKTIAVLELWKKETIK